MPFCARYTSNIGSPDAWIEEVSGLEGGEKSSGRPGVLGDVHDSAAHGSAAHGSDARDSDAHAICAAALESCIWRAELSDDEVNEVWVCNYMACSIESQNIGEFIPAIIMLGTHSGAWLLRTSKGM